MKSKSLSKIILSLLDYRIYFGTLGRNQKPIESKRNNGYYKSVILPDGNMIITTQSKSLAVFNQIATHLQKFFQ
jgi:hypothetical protein